MYGPGDALSGGGERQVRITRIEHGQEPDGSTLIRIGNGLLIIDAGPDVVHSATSSAAWGGLTDLTIAVTRVNAYRATGVPAIITAWAKRTGATPVVWAATDRDAIKLTTVDRILGVDASVSWGRGPMRIGNAVATRPAGRPSSIVITGADGVGTLISGPVDTPGDLADVIRWMGTYGSIREALIELPPAMDASELDGIVPAEDRDVIRWTGTGSIRRWIELQGRGWRVEPVSS